MKTWTKFAIAGTAIVGIAVTAHIVSSEYLNQLSEETAIQKCEQLVTADAKYPGGVQFLEPDKVWASYPEQEFTIQRVYHIDGEVDFPNGFGTPVRHSYTCEITVEDDKVIQSSHKLYDSKVAKFMGDMGYPTELGHEL